jgi:hypothetical protein
MKYRNGISVYELIANKLSQLSRKNIIARAAQPYFTISEVGEKVLLD